MTGGEQPLRKRLISIALALFACLALALGMVPGVSASDTVGMVIEPTPKTVAVGETFTVNITVTISAGEEVNSAGAHLDFDTDYLRVESITPGTALSEVLQNEHDNPTGTIDYDAGVPLGDPPVTTDFVLATVTFYAKMATSGTPLTFVFTPATRETSAYVDTDNVLDPADVIDGNVIITGAGVPPVGGTAHPISKVAIVALWIAVGAAIIVGISLLVRRRRRATR
jgi:hypothetical protein